MSEKKLLSVGVSNQDQLFTDIKSTWEKTDDGVKHELLKLLEEDDMEEFRWELEGSPSEWLEFFQKCIIAGLRESVLRFDVGGRND